MHRALDVPTLVIVVVERLEVDVARVRIDPGQCREVGQPHARADRDRGPTFDTKVVESISRARQRTRDRPARAGAVCSTIPPTSSCHRPRAASSHTGTVSETKYEESVCPAAFALRRGTSIDV